MRRLLATVLLCLICFSLGARSGSAVDAGPATPAGDELWQSLPLELLADVIEGKMEEISAYQDRIRSLEAEIARVQEIQAGNMSVARPPPEE